MWKYPKIRQGVDVEKINTDGRIKWAKKGRLLLQIPISSSSNLPPFSEYRHCVLDILMLWRLLCLRACTRAESVSYVPKG